MRSTIIHAPGDVRVDERPDPTIIEVTDAIIRTVATCVSGSDLWRYRGIQEVPRPTPIGHLGSGRRRVCRHGRTTSDQDAVASVGVPDSRRPCHL